MCACGWLVWGRFWGGGRSFLGRSMRVRAVVVGPGCTGPARNVEVIQEKEEKGVTREGHAVRTHMATQAHEH